MSRLPALLLLTAALVQSAPEHRRRGVELLQQNRVAAAVAELEAAVALDPDDSAAHFHLGRALYASGERERAVEQLLLALPGSADPGAVDYQLGVVWLASGQLAEAWQALLQASALKPGLRPAQYALAEVCYRVGAVTAARRRLSALAEITPGWSDPEVRAAELALESGEAEKAAAWLARALEISGDRPGLWIRHGDALAAAFDLDGAETAYRHAVQLAPEATSPRVALAYHLFNEQKFEMAEVELAGALGMAPRDPSVLLPDAESLLYLGRSESALAAVEAALSALDNVGTGADPGGLQTLRVGVLELQARILVQFDRLAEAEHAARSALELSPRSVEAHFVLGTVLQRRGDSAAQETLRTFKRLSDAREHRELGDEYLRLADDAVTAEREYRAALQIDPEDPAARIGLGRALLARGDATGAAAVLGPLRSRDANDPRWARAWVLSLHGSGRDAEAAAAWQAARDAGLTLGPEVWAVMRHEPGVCDEH